METHRKKEVISMSYREKVSELKAMVERYEQLGINPLSLATGCAVKVDLIRVVYPAIQNMHPEIRGGGLKILPREDADIIETCTDGLELIRGIYKLGRDTELRPDEVARIRPERCIVLVQVYQRYADDPDKFRELLEPIYKVLAKSGVEIYLGKGHSISTPFENDDFILIDFLRRSDGEPCKYTVVNNDTIHIVDPTNPPTDYRQVAGALSNSLNDVFIMGGYKDIEIAPVVNAPDEDIGRVLWRNIIEYGRRYGFKVYEDIEQPSRGRLLLGATVMADTDREPPTFYRYVRKGMKIIASRPFGELSVINVYLAAILNESIHKDLENLGCDLTTLEKDKEEIFELISKPNLKLAKIINKYLPEYGSSYSPHEHILAVTDVTGPGIYVIYELAERLTANIEIYNVPILKPFYSEYASKNYLMLNATSGTNGGHIIVAPEEVTDDIVGDLRREGYNPVVIGEVADVGQIRLSITDKILDYVKDRRIIEKLNILRNKS